MIALGPPNQLGVRTMIDGGVDTAITIEPFTHGRFAVCESRAYRSSHPDLQAAIEAAAALFGARNGGRIILGDDPMTHPDNAPKLRASKGRPEADFQRQVIARAKAHGWLCVAYRAAQTAKGYRTPVQGDRGGPDLLLARGGVVWLWELKSEKGRPDEEQRKWGEAIGDRYRLFRPSDIDAILELLS